MPTYVEYELEDGLTILIEVPGEQSGGVVRAGRGGESAIVKAEKKFREALAGAKTQAKLLLAEVEDLHVSEAELKFGLTASAELSSLVIGKLGADVNYEVTLKWKKPEEQKK